MLAIRIVDLDMLNPEKSKEQASWVESSYKEAWKQDEDTSFSENKGNLISSEMADWLEDGSKGCGQLRQDDVVAGEAAVARAAATACW